MNDVLYHTSSAPGALRQNEGPLHMVLNAKPNGTQGLDRRKIAAMSYYNYAFEDRDVVALYNKGFTNTEYTERYNIYNKDVRLRAGGRNRLDLTDYNDEMHIYPSTPPSNASAIMAATT